MPPRDVTLEIRTWAFRDDELPRVPPAGWAETTDSLRAAVCVAIECACDAVVSIEPFEGPARERERFDAVVTDTRVEHEYVTVRTPEREGEKVGEGDDGGGSGGNDGGDSSNNHDSTPDRANGFESRTEQFDIDDALERL